MDTVGIVAISILIWVFGTFALIALVEFAIGASRRYFKQRRGRHPSWTRYG